MCIGTPWEGTLTPPQLEPPQCLQPNLYPRRAVCGTSPQYSPPRLRAHSSQAEDPRFVPCRTTRTPSSTFLEGEEKGVGERPVCSVATSGCPKRSEDGFPAGARNIPPRPVEAIRKAPRRSPGLLERLTGIEPAYQAWEACALPLSYSRIFFSVSRLLAGGEICCVACWWRGRG